jgi:hypothetical protein
MALKWDLFGVFLMVRMGHVFLEGKTTEIVSFS